MDHSYPYIASLSREPFFFYEMCPIAKLMSEGLSDEAIASQPADETKQIYMHCYQPDTIARIRTDYVHEQQDRYCTSIADQMISIDLDNGMKKNGAIFKDISAKIK